jgi:hypothetical protein
MQWCLRNWGALVRKTRSRGLYKGLNGTVPIRDLRINGAHTGPALHLLYWKGKTKAVPCHAFLVVLMSNPVKVRHLETGTVVPQAATTALLIAGLAQWVRFVYNRWQEKSLQCAWPITYESHDFFFKEVAVRILVQYNAMLSL